MPDPIIARTCGNCLNSIPDPRGNLKQRVCKAAPPSCVAIPQRQGMLIQAFWPVVNVDDFCFAHKEKQLPILGFGTIGAKAN